MMNRTLLLCALISVSLWFCGCQPLPSPSNGNGNTNSNGNADWDNSVNVNLGGSSQFDLSGGGAVDQQTTVSLANELGLNQLSALAFAVNSDQVTVQPANSGTATSNGLTTLDLFIAPADTLDACADGISVGRFDISFNANTVTAITPEQQEADAEALAAAGDGTFELCLRATSDIDQTLIVNRLQVRFNAVMPSLSCSEILALDEVQEAIRVLEDHSLTFALQKWDTPRNLEGTYSVRQTIKFDPDGSDSYAPIDRMDIFTNQTADGIMRTTGEVAIEQSLSGSENAVNLCVLARSHGATCDQTIARLESYTVNLNGSLSGEFLAVVTERHTAGPSSCGATGDFIFGYIGLLRQSTTFLVTRFGKVSLPENFDPDLLILPNDGSRGTVTDFQSDAAFHFTQEASSITTPLGVPGQLDADGYNGIALTRDNSLLALVSDHPDELLVFDNVSGSLIVEAAAGGDELGGDVFDFSVTNKSAYVVSPDPDGDEDNLSVFGTLTGSAVVTLDRFPTPGAETPELSRLNPKGDQLAVLLNGEAGAGESQLLTFFDITTETFSEPIDLREQTNGFVGERYLVYNLTGSRVFLAGDNGVVAVDTTAPFAITNIDVSGEKGDLVVAIDLSNDGKVLVAAVDAINGENNFAVVDANTLAVLNRQKLERISNRGAIDIAHFETGRACLVINEQLRVVPVQTVEPYAVADPLSAADYDSAPLLGRVAVGGSVIAVANTSEPAIYLYQLAP